MQNIYKQKRNNQVDKAPLKARKSYLALLGAPSDWVNLLIVLICLGIVVRAAEQAKWLNPSPSLLTIMIISQLTGFFTAKSRWAIIFSFALSAVVGAAVVFWQCIVITPGIDLSSRLLHLGTNLQLFWDALTLGLPIPVTIHVALVFGSLSWIIGYFSSWFLIRKYNPWPAVTMGTILLLVILNFWHGKNYTYFLFFLMAALILLVSANYTNQLGQVVKNEIKKSTRLFILWLSMSLCIAVIALSFAWTNPGFGIKPVAEFASVNNPYRSTIDHAWQNFFAQIPGSGAPSLVHGGQADLTFGGSLAITDQVDFIIESERQNYWKTQIYDFYDSTGWKNNPTVDLKIEPSPNENENQDTAAANTLSYVIIPQLNTSVLPTTGELISAGEPAIIKNLVPLTFVINLSDSSKDSLLPADITSVAQSLRNARVANRRLTDPQLIALIPANLKVVKTDVSGNRIQNISVSRNLTESSTSMALSSSKAQVPQQKFNITVKMPNIVQAQDLAQVGANYEKDITDRYLQLPASLPSRVKELAKSITGTSTTQYDKTIALKKYLSQYPYTLTIETPATDADGVDFFLFTQKSGYCTYFASAMTVMLRSVGVPARMVTGFLTGQYITETRRGILRDRDFHAWTEVYFPGYGWLTLDSTPGIVSTESASSAPDAFPTPPEIEVPEETPLEEDLTIPEISVIAAPEINDKPFLIIGYALIFSLLVVYLLFRRKTRYGPNLYSPMIFLASLGGLGPKPWQTAMEFCEQISSALPEQATVIQRIISHYVIVSYSSEKTFVQKDVDKQSWNNLKKALIKRIMHIG